jgi:hypothetical protein
MFDLTDLLKEQYPQGPAGAPGDCGILTAASRDVFPGLQFLLVSLALCNKPIQVTVVDVGLEPAEVEWITATGATILKPEINEEIPWHILWNKPTYWAQSPYQRTVWLDADTLLFRDVNPLFAVIMDRMFFTMDAGRWPSFDTTAVTSLGLEWNDFCPYINTGVLGWGKDRDDWFIAQAVHYCQRAAKTKAGWNRLADQMVVQGSDQPLRPPRPHPE